MRLPFLRKATTSDPIVQAPPPLKTPEYKYKPSDTLTLILHLPANGFVHLQPPLTTDIPGEYDHILTGDLEIIAPPDWDDKVENMIVGVKALSKLFLGPGRENEIDTLFDRSVNLDNVILSPGSQRFTFSLILPSELPAPISYGQSRVTIRAYAEVVTISTKPPKSTSQIDDFGPLYEPSPTSIEVLGSQVIYRADMRMRVGHRTERDANFVTLNNIMQGLDSGLGIYDIRLLSDIWSVAAPFYFNIKLPSLSPLLTLFTIRLSMIQLTSIRSPRDPPATPAISTTSKIILAEIGSQVPENHVHPGKECKSLWRGTDAGGRGGGDGYEGMIYGRVPWGGRLLRSTIPGTLTPLTTKHHLAVEIYYSVYGQYADGQKMSPQGAGELRIFRRSEAMILPACVNVPGILNLPTYEDSSKDQGEGFCACQMPEATVMERMKKHVAQIRREDEEREEAARAKEKQAQR